MFQPSRYPVPQGHTRWPPATSARTYNHSGGGVAVSYAAPAGRQFPGGQRRHRPARRARGLPRTGRAGLTTSRVARRVPPHMRRADHPFQRRFQRIRERLDAAQIEPSGRVLGWRVGTGLAGRRGASACCLAWPGVVNLPGHAGRRAAAGSRERRVICAVTAGIGDHCGDGAANSIAGMGGGRWRRK